MSGISKDELINKEIILPKSFEEEGYLSTKSIQNRSLKISSDILAKLKEELLKENIFIESDDLLKEIVIGIIKGNIILQGPPGTGKTTIASIICEVFNVNYNIITAVNDWTTYDTIGGYQPSINEDGEEIIIGKNGRIVQSVLSCCNDILVEEYSENQDTPQQAHWLIIDELNRAEIDRVFGDLFTALGTDDLDKRKLNLWFQRDINKRKLYIPRRYRIIGTMNTIDKNFVYDLSQGLSRRFTFININPPSEEYFKEEIEVIKSKIKRKVFSKLEGLNDQRDIEESIQTIYEDQNFKLVEKDLLEFLKLTRYDKKNGLDARIGTAQIIDVYEYIIIKLILDKFNYIEEDHEKETLVYLAADSALKTEVVSQLDGQNYEKLRLYHEYISSVFKKFPETIDAISIFI